MRNLNCHKQPLVRLCTISEQSVCHYCLKKNYKLSRMFLLILEWLEYLLFCLHETRGCLLGSEILLFGYVYLYKNPLSGNRKYFAGSFPKVQEIFLHVYHHKLAVRHYYPITGYFCGYSKLSIAKYSKL